MFPLARLALGTTLALASSSSSASASASGVPSCPLGDGAEGLLALFKALERGAPASAFDEDIPKEARGTYVRPSPSDRAAFRDAIGALLDMRVTDGIESLRILQIDVCHLPVDDSEPLLIVYDALGFDRLTSRGWPAIALRTDAPAQSTVLSAPHAVTERSITTQTVDVLAAAPNVRAAILGPVHRCNLLELAPDEFQGETSECNGVYRVSDMAHNLDTLFQEAHEALIARFPADHLVQIHGMSSAGISVSHGVIQDTVDYPSMPSALVHATLSAALVLTGIDVNDLTTCSFHDGPGGDRFARRHCGTRNAQLAGLRAHGLERKFVHLEQSRPVRDDPVRRLALSNSLNALAGLVFAHDFDSREETQNAQP